MLNIVQSFDKLKLTIAQKKKKKKKKPNKGLSGDKRLWPEPLELHNMVSSGIVLYAP